VYGEPSRQLWLAGVTGTNGKTSCSHWIAQSLTRLAARCRHRHAGQWISGSLVAAHAHHARRDQSAAAIAELVAQGASHLAMEVSSHGLDQGRVNGAAFAAALFTNLSRDHLDYHGSMDSYGAPRRACFTGPAAHAVINLDDDFGARLAASLDRRASRRAGLRLGKGEISGTCWICPNAASRSRSKRRGAPG
jgi:UDP-N-acetylmuramoyl-L-alanyl-D-glutamate--2,6-diaminopimelate ligase